MTQVLIILDLFMFNSYYCLVHDITHMVLTIIIIFIDIIFCLFKVPGEYLSGTIFFILRKKILDSL